jgi:hypothetical protein
VRLRIIGDELQHRHDSTAPTDDVRIAITVCGIRFAWGRVVRSGRAREQCGTCFP